MGGGIRIEYVCNRCGELDCRDLAKDDADLIVAGGIDFIIDGSFRLPDGWKFAKDDDPSVILCDECASAG